MKHLLLLAFCVGLIGCSMAGDDDSAPSLPELRSAPASVSLGGRNLVLTTYLWRDFQPISPPNGRALIAIFSIASLDSSALPSSLNVDGAWLVNGDSVWNVEFTNEEPGERQPFQLQKIARGGPKWGPGIEVEAVVRVSDGQSGTYLIRAPNQPIWRTD